MPVSSLLLLSLLTIADAGVPAAPEPTCPAETVEATLEHFRRAFEALDEERFLGCFTADATVFHPRAPDVARTEGRDGFVAAWRGVFARLRRSSARSAPPYHRVVPTDLRIEPLTPDVALVTFHLRSTPGQLGRRTLVMRRLDGRWRIAHVHASNLVEEPAR